MTPETLSQWRQDSSLMREFVRSPEWSVLQRHLDVAIEASLARLDSCEPSATADIVHWRAVRKGFMDAKDLPQSIIRQTEALEAQAKFEAARLKGR